MIDFFTDMRKKQKALLGEVICLEIKNLFVIFNYRSFKQSRLFIFTHFKVIFTSKILLFQRFK